MVWGHKEPHRVGLARLRSFWCHAVQMIICGVSWNAGEQCVVLDARRPPISVASPNGLASHVDRMSRDNHLFSLHQAERAPHIKRREFSHRIKPRELSSHRIKRRCGGPSYQTERALLVVLSGENSSHRIKRRELCISSGEGFSHHAMPLHDVFDCENQFVITVRTQNGLWAWILSHPTEIQPDRTRANPFATSSRLCCIW